MDAENDGQMISLMKTPDIAQKELVRRYGLRGVKLFARLWFAALYGMLIVCGAGLWILAPEATGSWRRVLFGSIVAVLVIVAASVLTRMRLRYFAGIERLESQQRIE
jgi:uncharacterized BrkB/YihY/UPF0761 family membrane protein